VSSRSRDNGGVSRKPPRARFRKTVALLLITATVITPVAIAAVWLREELLNTDRYVATVTPLASNRAIVAAVSDQIATRLLDQVDASIVEKEVGVLSPLIGASAHSYVQQVIERLLGTTQFKQLWITVNMQAHEALVAGLEGKRSSLVAPDGSVDLDLSNMVAAARDALVADGLTIFEKVDPNELGHRFTIARPDTLRKARQAVSVLKKLAIALPVAAAVLYGLALLISRERRRTLLRTGVGLAVAGILGVAAVLAGRWFYLHHVVGTQVPADAARAFYNTVFRTLRLAYEITCLAGVGAVLVAIVAGPSRSATRIRATTLSTAGGLADTAVGDSATSSWVAANKSTLRTVTVVLGLLFLLAAHHQTLRLGVEIAIVVLLVLGLIEILARPHGRGRSAVP
jgi:hypothetical protein